MGNLVWQGAGLGKRKRRVTEIGAAQGCPELGVGTRRCLSCSTAFVSTAEVVLGWVSIRGRSCGNAGGKKGIK